MSTDDATLSKLPDEKEVAQLFASFNKRRSVLAGVILVLGRGESAFEYWHDYGGPSAFDERKAEYPRIFRRRLDMDRRKERWQAQGHGKDCEVMYAFWISPEAVGQIPLDKYMTMRRKFTGSPQQ